MTAKIGIYRKLFNKNNTFEIAAAAMFLVGFLIRLYWVVEVQPPGDAIDSDMKRYITRATNLAAGTQEDHQSLATFPYGTHYLYALEMLVFGKVNYEAMAVMQALLSAACVLFIMLATRRCFQSPVAAYIVGGLTCFWYPQITFAGFFSSETPFVFFVCLNLWLWIRFIQTGKGATLVGISAALGFAVRPQIILTTILGFLWLGLRRKDLPHLRWRSLIWICVPLLVVIAFSSQRYWHFTGRYGLISDNGAIGRFFASTDYLRIEADRIKANGDAIRRRDGSIRTRYFHPPARSKRHGFSGTFRFGGYIANPEPLNAERKRIEADQSLVERIGKIRRNLSFLAFNNLMWPERREAKRGIRKQLLVNSEPIIQYLLLPLALLGLGLLAVRKNPALEMAALQLLTMLYAASFYFGEMRYRVPYDPVLILFAVFGVMALIRKRDEKITERTGKERWLVSAGVAVLCILLFIPWDGF